MSKSNKTSGGFTSLMAFLTIVIALVIGIIVYKYFLGDPNNFEGFDPKAKYTAKEIAEILEKGHPKDGNLAGTIYKGGFIVPILIAMNLIVIFFSIERFVTLSRAKGRGSIDKFVEKIRTMLEKNEVHQAVEVCDRQRGSVANVVRAGLEKYEHIGSDSGMDKEQKVEALKKELEEATSLELPMLSKNLGVLSTSASVSTLIGLIGTVLGMIKAFQAMSQGAPDSTQLATGISEALVNTAFGIIASTLAIILYNFFSTKIDNMTYSMDEASFSIVQDFSSKTTK